MAIYHGIVHLSMVYMVMILFTNFNVSHELPAVTRLHFGINFHPVGQTSAKSDYYHHTFYFVLPTLHERTFPQHKCFMSVKPDVCNDYKLITDLIMSFVNETYVEFRRILQATYDLIPNSPLPSNLHKPKRSFLPFMGNILSSLFGTATESDIQMLNQHIKAFGDIQYKYDTFIEQHIASFSSYMVLNQKRFNKIESLLNYTYLHMQESFWSQTQTINNQHAMNIATMYHIFKKIIEYLQLYDELSQFYNAIELISMGYLPSNFISAASLQKILDDVAITLRITLPQFKLVHNDPAYYYKHAQFLTLRNNNELYITLKLPITVLPSFSLLVYEVIHFPISFPQNSSLLTVLDQHPKYFLVADDSSFYSEADDLLFPLEHLQISIFRFPSQPSCLMALYQNDFKLINTLCKYSVIKDDFKPSISIINYPLVLFRHIDYFQLVCTANTSSHTGCSYCFYNIPCKCSIHTSDFIIPARIQTCTNDLSSEPTSLIPQYNLNLPLLQYFFDNLTLNPFLTKDLLSNPISVDLPPFSIFNHTFESEIASSHDISLELDRVINASKSDKLIFRSMVDPLVSGDLILPFNFFSTFKGYLVTASCILTAVNTFLIVWLLFKLKFILTTLPLLLSHSPAVHAQTFPTSLIFTTTSLPSTTPHYIYQYVSSINTPVLITFIFIISIYFLFKCYKKANQHFSCTSGFDLQLHIQGFNQCFIFNIQNFAGCPQDYLIKGRKIITRIIISGWIFPKLCISWDNSFVITHKSSNINIILNSQCPISFISRFKLFTLFRQSYSYSLYLLHGNHVVLVSSPQNYTYPTQSGSTVV